MATYKETIEYILQKLADKRFTTRAMFGEYALYANGKVVALVCDDLLYVKILPASAPFERECEKSQPYPGAKQHYIVDESQIASMEDLPAILLAIARSLPAKKSKGVKKGASRATPGSQPGKALPRREKRVSKKADTSSESK